MSLPRTRFQHAVERRKKREVETNLTLCAQRRGEPALHHRLDGGGAVADQLGPPAPAAAGQVAGCPSPLGQDAEVAEAVGQVAGAAGGQGAGGGGAGCWVVCQEEPLSAGAGGDQGGKLCSMQMHRQGEERKKERKRRIGNGQLKYTTSKRVKELEPQPNSYS